MRYLAFAAAALALAGSAATAKSSQPAPPLVWVGFGETAKVYGPKVTPLALVEDSRCPSSVECVSAGRVRLSVRVTSDSRSHEIELTQGEAVRIVGGSLKLAEVKPKAKVPGNIPPENYRFGLNFTVGAPGAEPEEDSNQAVTGDF